jgi:cytochrome c-type biogenesis protein CcmH/NrfF
MNFHVSDQVLAITYDNAQRYNLSFKESGSTILLWFVPGMFILVGPFISLYIHNKEYKLLSV